MEQFITHISLSASISFIALRKLVWSFTARPLPPNAIETYSYFAQGDRAKTLISFGP